MRENRESYQMMLIALLLMMNLVVSCITLYRFYPENPSSVFSAVNNFESKHADTLNRLSTQINEVQALSEVQVQQIIKEVRKQFDKKLIEYVTDPDAFEQAVDRARKRLADEKR